MASLGTLTLDVVAKIGGYTAGLSSAQREAEKRAKAIEKAFDGAAKGIGVAFGLMAAGAVAAFAAFDGLVKQVADFQDLAEKTGASAEALASFAVAAKVGGANMEEIAGASQRLSKSLVGVDDESKAAGAAIAALGINLKEFKALAPEDQLETVAKALEGFEDGAQKTAVAMALFGKAGANLLPFLKELGGGIGRVTVLTQEQIVQADAYADAQARSQAQLQLYAQSIAVQALPAVTAFTESLTALASSLFEVDKAGASVANSKVGEFAEDAARFLASLVDIAYAVGQGFNYVGKTIAATAAIVEQIARGNLAGAKSIAEEARRQGEAMKFSLGLLDQLDARLSNRGGGSSGGRGSGFNDPRILGPVPPIPKAQLDFAGAIKADRKTGGKTQKEEISEASNALAAYVKSLQGVIDKTEELTEVEKANKFLLGLGKTGEIPQVRELVLGLAERADKEKEINELIKDRIAFAAAEGDAVNAANEKRGRELDAIYNSTPTAKLEEQRRIIGELTLDFTNGLKTQAEYEEAVSSFLDLNADKLEKTKSLTEELGLSFSSAFEDAIVGGKGLSGVLKGLEQDILRIVTRKLVTEPLGNALTGMLGNAFGGSGAGGGFLSGITSSIGGFFKNLIGFDGGGSTGTGPRAGGLDGKGGFMAMLHPQEQVIDRSKGQRGGGGVVVNLNQSFAPGTDRRTVLQAAAEAQLALERGQRNL